MVVCPSSQKRDLGTPGTPRARAYAFDSLTAGLGAGQELVDDFGVLFTSSLMRGYMPTKTPSMGLMLAKAVRNAASMPSLAMRPAARILNAKQGLGVWRMTLYILGGSLWR